MHSKIFYQPFLLLLSVVAISGCSSAPPEVTASRSLISQEHNQTFKQHVPDELTQQLSEKADGSEFEYKGIGVVLIDHYTSALGHFCRNVKLTPINTDVIKEQQHRVICQTESDGWFVIPQVIENKFRPIAFE